MAILLITFSLVSKAGVVDVTSSSSINVPQGGTVEFGFNISNFARDSGSYNPYPTSLDFQILGQTSAGQASGNLPGSSQQYDPVFLLDATLTAADGGASVPLVDSAATRLGLKSGSMVVTTGVLQGSQTSTVNMINASVQLTPQESALIFGSNIASESDIAYVVLHNDGPAFSVGIGAGYTLSSAMLVSNVTGCAPLSTGGATEQVRVLTATPEPRTYATLAAALTLLLAVNLFQRSRKLKSVSA